MGPDSPADAQAPGSPQDEEAGAGGEMHQVAPRRPDGPTLDDVAPLTPAAREHHGG